MRDRRSRILVAATAVAAALALIAACARAGSPPLVETIVGRAGWRVDRARAEADRALEARGIAPARRQIEEENLCASASGDSCRLGVESGEAGGFASARGVAVESDRASPDYGNVYVASALDNRIQELSPSGRFVRMFGWGVNATKDARAGATQAERNVCTAAEAEDAGVRCGPGVRGTAAGQLKSPSSIAIDPVSGDVFVQEIAEGDYRVDRYTPQGRFVWAAGLDVNATEDRVRDAGAAQRNLCTAASHDACRGGVRDVSGLGHGAFDFIQSRGNLLAVGGPEHLLYVGDEYRVQELDTDGHWVRELPLESIFGGPFGWVTALAVDTAGDLYIVYPRAASSVRELSPSGEPIGEIPITPAQPGAQLEEIGTIALAPSGELGVGVEETVAEATRWIGSLYDLGNGRPIARFAGWGRSGIAFAGDGRLYAAAVINHYSQTGSELLIYTPSPAALLAAALAWCPAEAMFECALG